MDKLSMEEKIQLIKEDYNNEWWKPSKIDNFELHNKLFRVGCRPLKRKHLKCVTNLDSNVQSYKDCKKIESDLSECYNALYMTYMNTKRNEKL